jgi:hypothetical protein
MIQPIALFFSGERPRVAGFLPDVFLGAQHEKSRLSMSNRLFRVWLPIVDTYRTICLAPTREIKVILETVAIFRIS